MLQNARFAADTVSELFKENQQGGGGVKLPLTQIRVKPFDLLNTISLARTKTLVNNLLMSKF